MLSVVEALARHLIFLKGVTPYHSLRSGTGQAVSFLTSLANPANLITLNKLVGQNSTEVLRQMKMLPWVAFSSCLRINFASAQLKVLRRHGLLPLVAIHVLLRINFAFGEVGAEGGS